MATIRLTRFNYGFDVSPEVEGTFGRLELPDGTTLFTCEKAWKNNEKSVSCIPEGTYKLRMRRSGVVERSSQGKYKHGWEVTDVPDRTFIMFHVANWPEELNGCVAVGKTYGLLMGKLGIGHSSDAFDLFMEALNREGVHTLIIDHYEP